MQTTVIYVLSPPTPATIRPGASAYSEPFVDVAAARASMLLGGSIHSVHENVLDVDSSSATSLTSPKRQFLNSSSPTSAVIDNNKKLSRSKFLSKLTRFKLHIKKPEKMPTAVANANANANASQQRKIAKLADAANQQQSSSVRTNNNNNNKQTHACPVCFEYDKPMFTIKSCGDQICADCMHDYVCMTVFKLNVVAVSGEVECPMTNCKSRISFAEVTSLLNEPESQRLQWLRTLRQIDSNPKLIWCPRPGCCTPVDKFACHVPNVIIIPGFESTQLYLQNPPPWFVRCSCCATTFCVNCLGSPQMHRDTNIPNHHHHHHNHHEHDVHNEIAATPAIGGCKGIKDFMEETLRLLPDDVKHCPSCHVPVVRGDGCAQMFCWNCRHVFCWWCLANLTDDILLMHFEKGHCQGRLGHSRPNLLWHRLQAVALVTGAGLTMITLSPLMFVAVPIYVIAKHTRKMIRKQRVRRRRSEEESAAAVELQNAAADVDSKVKQQSSKVAENQLLLVRKPEMLSFAPVRSNSRLIS